ncbi:hypothetical protein CANARDRAFT_231038 [[Candida] arabinofermentans NRRL YB-2248]|uniref:Rab-GAP TBC domain-containing protein n=1 Tax=[Candida] arabinofermentans NRRL YB-2248 TaxID=983967 RepID=A0A1E4T519_9ASCO|nr:hypothetical protein CANARDRAFT_231038 [[Candida] arabinofermentans NRRL YB-2248]
MSCLQLNKVSKPQGEVELNLGNLRRLREDYTTLRNEFQVPWNELPVDNEYYQTININDDHDITEGVSKKIELSRLRVQHDPLSLDDNTEHGNTITDLQTLETLITDVNRLFPEMPEYFINSLENRKRLIRILFNWWKLTGHSYSQGLHELVGLIFIVFQKECATTESFETVSFTKLENQVIELLDENFLEHDTFNVFNVLIGPVIEKYYKETSLLQETVKFDLRLFETDKFQYHLFKNKLKLDSTIWLIRYFRLLLIREIGVDNSVQLWDKLICFGYIQDHTKIDMTLLLPYLIILLLSMIKSRLIISDYGEALFLLLHYPIEHEGTSKPIGGLSLGASLMRFTFGDDSTKLDSPKNSKVDGGSYALSKKKSTRDFDRTRLEMKLAKKVNDAMKK